MNSISLPTSQTGTIFEMLRNEIMFAGRSNNDQLKVIMDKKGKLSTKMIKSGTSWQRYFDAYTMDFLYLLLRS